MNKQNNKKCCEKGYLKKYLNFINCCFKEYVLENLFCKLLDNKKTVTPNTKTSRVWLGSNNYSFPF